MQILLAFIFGAVMGLVAHFVLPRRDLRGAALAPVTGALVGGAVWLALTWAGVATDNPLIWFASAVVPAVVVFPLVMLLTRVRRSRDAREAARLKIA